MCTLLIGIVRVKGHTVYDALIYKLHNHVSYMQKHICTIEINSVYVPLCLCASVAHFIWKKLHCFIVVLLLLFYSQNSLQQTAVFNEILSIVVADKTQCMRHTPKVKVLWVSRGSCYWNSINHNGTIEKELELFSKSSLYWIIESTLFHSWDAV